jgi:nicotinamidase/pyrazinamidase
MKTVFFDVDTQIDFMLPSGALYVPGAERVIERVAALNRHAAGKGWPVISTMDAHAENDPEFRDWPGHCIAGTLGQRKPESTLLARRIVIPSVDAAERIDGFEQIVLEKQHLDCFTNPNLEWLLTAFDAQRYVVYGVVSEICVRFAAFGLLDTGKRVEIVEDAVRALDEAKSAAMFDEFRGRGGVVSRAATLLYN